MSIASILAFFFVYYVLAGLAINLGYHRVLAHRSLKLPKWLERTLVTLGLPTGTPVQWVGNHRYHHAHTDTPLDPHSPLQRGFWYAHVGWYLGSDNVFLCVLYSLAGPFRLLIDAWMRPRTNQEFSSLAPDVSADPWYRLISRPWPYAAAMHLHFLVPVLAAWYLWGIRGCAIVWLTLVALYNMGDAIDSIAHMFGNQLSGQHDRSRNSFVMGLLILGEGWHANHHRFPWSAKHGLARGQFDWTWQVIRVLRAVGLAREIRIPTAPDFAGPTAVSGTTHLSRN
ncbi:MAG TPA: acyl-CoA desaturase [Terracidiphilus sp.]|nr:acyl-CoA desaturase [Terracidiphilus sp.]